MPDWTRFSALLGDVLERCRRQSPHAIVRAYGEMVDLLWRDGQRQAALSLEGMWNDLARHHALSLLCAYVMGNFYRTGDAESFHDICRTHSHVLPLETSSSAENPDARRREISELQQRTRALEKELEHRKELEVALREALLREKEAREEAERSVRYNEMFAGMLGHDLRNPLSAITTGANYIARLNSSQKSTKTATRILASAERMGRMIDQLLDFTRIRVGDGLGLMPSRFDLEEVCCRVKDELEPSSPDRLILVEVMGNVVGEWDHERILQVVSNLASNALHHGTEGSLVRLRCDGRDPAQVELSVSNDGGRQFEVLPVLFEAPSGATRALPADGAGSAWAYSSRSRSSRRTAARSPSPRTKRREPPFRFGYRAGARRGRTPRSHRRRFTLSRHRECTVTATTAATKMIVVVDDEEAICETLKDVFEEEGYAVEIATNGIDRAVAHPRHDCQAGDGDPRPPHASAWTAAPFMPP